MGSDLKKTSGRCTVHNCKQQRCESCGGLHEQVFDVETHRCTVCANFLPKADFFIQPLAEEYKKENVLPTLGHNWNQYSFDTMYVISKVVMILQGNT